MNNCETQPEKAAEKLLLLTIEIETAAKFGDWTVVNELYVVRGEAIQKLQDSDIKISAKVAGRIQLIDQRIRDWIQTERNTAVRAANSNANVNNVYVQAVTRSGFDSSE